MAHERMLRVQR